MHSVGFILQQGAKRSEGQFRTSPTHRSRILDANICMRVCKFGKKRTRDSVGLMRFSSRSFGNTSLIILSRFQHDRERIHSSAVCKSCECIDRDVIIRVFSNQSGQRRNDLGIVEFCKCLRRLVERTISFNDARPRLDDFRDALRVSG